MAVDRVIITYLYYGQVMQNVVHFFNPDGQIDENAVALDMKNNFVRFLLGASQVNCQCNQISVQRVAPSGTAPVTIAVTITGAQSGNPYGVPFECFVIRLKTGLSGRHQRGRIYVPGPNSDLTVNGLWGQGAIQAWQSNLTAIGQNYVGSNRSSPLGLAIAPRNNPGDYKLVNSVQLNPIPGIQRRRNIGVGA